MTGLLAFGVSRTAVTDTIPSLLRKFGLANRRRRRGSPLPNRGIPKDGCYRLWTDAARWELKGLRYTRVKMSYIFRVVVRTRDRDDCDEGDPPVAAMQTGYYVTARRKKRIEVWELAGLPKTPRVFGFAVSGDGYTDDSGGFHPIRYSTNKQLILWSREAGWAKEHWRHR